MSKAAAQNIVRLVKDGNGIYQIDQTFTTHNWDGNNYSGGFGGSAFALTVLPNGKIMVGGFFSYYGDNITGYSTSHLVRLNSNGTLDTTFTFQISAVVYTTDLLFSGILLVGGRFSTPQDLMLELFIGEEYELRSFDTCDGETSNIFLPTGYQVQYNDNIVTSIPYSPIDSGLLTLVDLSPYTPPVDDRNYHVELPMDFDVDFLGQTYTSVFVGTNSYITFGGGADCYGLKFPDDIPKTCDIGPAGDTGLNSLPGIIISTFGDSNFEYLGDNDTELKYLYTGSTDGGNNTVIRFEGIYYSDRIISTATTVVFNYIFYKDNPNIIDIIIEQNPKVGVYNPLGGISNGTSRYIGTFTCNSQTSWRLDVSSASIKPIKANVNERVAVCGTVGDVITTPQLNGGGIGGSMYFDGVNDTMVQIDNGGGQFGFNGLNDFTIEWFQYYEGGENSRPFSIGVYNNPSEMIGMSFEGGVNLWIDNGAYSVGFTNADLLNGWHHIAITRNFDTTNHIWRVFLDGINKFEIADNTDTSNTDTLTLGNQLNNDGKFQGYITNFRVNNLTALYTADFTVPTLPLPCDGNSILTMDATSESSLLFDSCETQTISSTGVTWSNKTPFPNPYGFSLFTATNTTNYGTCEDCGQTYKSRLFIRDGVNANSVKTMDLTLNSIEQINLNGPIFTILGPECYELLTYYY